MNYAAFIGRYPIYTDREIIDRHNVVDVLVKALPTHVRNSGQIDFLYKYYAGDQPILNREKKVRSEINNTVVENRAIEIVNFKTAYLIGEPVQYVSNGAEDMREPIKELNEYMRLAHKHYEDKALVWWSHIAGTAYRMTMPALENREDKSPFDIYSLDPRDAFVIYWSGLGHKPVMGVYIVTTGEGKKEYYCYTDRMYYKIVDREIVEERAHLLRDVPIVEYPLNFARLGAFEPVLSMLDAINTVSSNRLDGIEQFVQALLVLIGVDMEKKQFLELKELGGVQIPPGGDIKYLVQELNQMQTQTLVDYLYQTVLTICGMPNRNGGSSTSDTGVAVHIRDGWEAAENRAKDTEGMFVYSEENTLRLVSRIISVYRDVDLRLRSIDVRFTRRNYENIQEKSQVLTTMLGSEKIHPLLGFEHCGMFSDPEEAYRMSVDYEKKVQAQKEAELKALSTVETPDEPVNEDV